MARELSPYVEIERSAWADLADDVPQPLTEDDVQRLKGLGEELDIDEVRQVYLPLTELISLRVRAATRRRPSTRT